FARCRALSLCFLILMCSVLKFFNIDEALRQAMVLPNNIPAPCLTSFKVRQKSLLAHTTPATASLLPLMNLVRLCMTISAPNTDGVMLNGEKVLSTTRGRSYFFASLDKAAISETSNKGLLRVSQ